MKVFITGGSGFVGTALSLHLLGRGHSVIAVGRSPIHTLSGKENYLYISAETTEPGDWQEALKNVDAAVNLAGFNIFRYWTDNTKTQIYDSRILTTRNLVEAMPADKGVTLCSTSGAGYYGNRGDEILQEDATQGADFLAKVSIEWEKEALLAKEKGIRVVTMRFGVVLGKGGGAMKKMIQPFKFFVGGPMGNGQHWFSWIHIDDLVSAILFILENPQTKGPVNFSSPNPVRNKDFAKALGKAIKRPSFMSVPSSVIRLIMGELGTSLLNSQRLSPDKLTKYGFKFQHPNISSALSEIVMAS